MQYPKIIMAQFYQDFLVCCLIFHTKNLPFQEWGKDCPPFVAAYKLEHDMTWTPQANIEAKENENAIIDKILKKQSHLAITFSQVYKKENENCLLHDLFKD